MAAIKNVAHFIRWRLIPLRYMGKVLFTGKGAAAPRTATAARVMTEGHAPGARLDPDLLEQMNAIYRPRIAGVVPSEAGHPFVNLFTAQDITVTDPIMRAAFSPQVLDVAFDYFNGDVIVDSIQALYSFPTQPPLRESQMWHKDYGDNKSFHWIAYLNDVNDAADGPLGYVDRTDTRRIRQSMFIRRIDDENFARELGKPTQREFLGPAGSTLFMDPAVCYHYGSRCRSAGGRLALFVTFNTRRPFVTPVPIVRDNREAMLAAAMQLRPDLSEQFLRGLLRF